MKAVVVYASQKGSTAGIAERIASVLQYKGILANTIDVATKAVPDKSNKALVLLTPIYEGMWLPEMTEFVKNTAWLKSGIPVWAMFPCIRVIEENGIKYAYDNYIPQIFLVDMNIRDIRFVAGKLLKSDISREEEVILFERYDGIQLAKISGDYRDWDEIDAWAYRIANQMLEIRVMS